MAESINDIAIKLSVDAAGVSRGFRTAAEETRAYKKQIDEFTYAVDKGFERQFGPILDEALNSQSLAKVKQDQADFNTWYAEEMDRITNEFIASETLKEKAVQDRLASERQMAIYTHNNEQMNRARPMPLEMESRGKELLALEESIRQRYALLDKEEQLAINQERINMRNAQRFRTHVDMVSAERTKELADLREYIQQKYAAAAIEEQQADLNMRNMLEVQRARNAQESALADQRVAQRAAEAAELRNWYATMEKQSELNASNSAEIDRVRNQQAQQAAEQAETIRQQDYANLRSHYVLMEQAAEQANAAQDAINTANAQRSRARQLQAPPEAETLSRAQENDALEAAIRSRYALQDQAKQQQVYNSTVNEANRIIQRHMTAQERYTDQLQELTRVYSTYNTETGKALLTEQQFARAKTALIIQTIRAQQAVTVAGQAAAISSGGYGGMSMAMGQASYAAEDFIQVLSMGGGLNMALMSASNNLSMVARALLGTSGMMASLAGIGIPAVLIGTSMFVRYLFSEEKQARSTADALRDLADAVNTVYDAKERALAQRFLLEDIQNMDDLNAANERAAEFERERLRLLLEQQEVEETLAKLRREAAEAAGTSIPLNPLLQEIANQINRGNPDMPQEDINAIVAEKTAELNIAYTQLQNALADGTDEQILQFANRYRDVLEQYTFLNGAFSGEFTDAAYARVDALLKEEDALDALKDAYGDEAVNRQAILDNEQALLALEQQRQQLVDEMARSTAEAQAAYKEELLFLSRATEAQKAILELKKEQDKFVGPAALGLMGLGGGPMDILMQNAMMQQNEADRIAFLQAKHDELAKGLLSGKDTKAMGGLEQNVYNAQAKAFGQVLAAASAKPDPQLEQLRQLLTNIERAIKDGGFIQVVP